MLPIAVPHAPPAGAGPMERLFRWVQLDTHSPKAADIEQQEESRLQCRSHSTTKPAEEVSLHSGSWRGSQQKTGRFGSRSTRFPRHAAEKQDCRLGASARRGHPQFSAAARVSPSAGDSPVIVSANYGTGCPNNSACSSLHCRPLRRKRSEISSPLSVEGSMGLH